MAHIEQETQQNPNDIRLLEVEKMSGYLECELNETKSNPTSPLNVVKRLNLITSKGGAGEFLENADILRVRTIVEGIGLFTQFAYAMYTFDHLTGIIKSRPTDIVYLNITESSEDEKVEEVVGRIIHEMPDTTERMIAEAKREGIEKALELMSNGTRLAFYNKEVIDLFATEEFTGGGSEYRLPTKLDGVEVSYFYPEEEQTPSISLVIAPI